MQFDHLSYGDFNPHLLYIGKKVPEVSGEDHSHDYLELTYILSGQARYYIEGKEYLLQPGDLLVVVNFAGWSTGAAVQGRVEAGLKPVGADNDFRNQNPAEWAVFHD